MHFAVLFLYNAIHLKLLRNFHLPLTTVKLSKTVIATWFVARQVRTWAVKHATVLFNSLGSNVARQVLRFCCPFYCSFKIWSWIGMNSFLKVMRFWETAHLPLPKANISTYFSLRPKCWRRGGVGWHFPEGHRLSVFPYFPRDTNKRILEPAWKLLPREEVDARDGDVF